MQGFALRFFDLWGLGFKVDVLFPPAASQLELFTRKRQNPSARPHTAKTLPKEHS